MILMTFNYKMVIKTADKADITISQLFVTLHAKNAKMSRKWRCQAPIGETLALSGHNQHPVS
jgi:hypothetical protein